MRLRIIAAGSAMAAAVVIMPATPSASAATWAKWDRVAQCESGQRWHLNTHNGYYGGLQFSRPTWKAYGGQRFRYWPNRATKAQQIFIANRVLRSQGWGAWPVCGRR